MPAVSARGSISSCTCRRTDSVLFAIEKCLSSRLDTCLVVDNAERLVGSIALDDLRRAIVDGTAAEGVALDRLMRDPPLPLPGGRLRNDPAPGDGVLNPVVGDNGRLLDVVIDRGRKFVSVARPDLSQQEFRALLDAFLSTWISSKGTHLSEFEQAFAAYIGVRHGIAVSNGTCALHLALVALGIGPGDEVIVPDLTFAATINAVLFCGATPVIVDIDRSTWGMSVESIAGAITKRTRAIMPVHLYGKPAAIGPIRELARRHGCFLVEDCAEAHGARHNGRRVGSFGDISCFSFYANKIITTGEGGMCLTDSDDLAARLRALRDHGMAPGRFYWHDRVGYNYRMTNLQAAIGLAQLRRIHEIQSRNARLATLYTERFRDLPQVRFAAAGGCGCEAVVWLVAAEVPAESRQSLIEAAAAAGIELRPFFNPLSAMPPYAAWARSCPNSAALSRSGINLPTSCEVDAHVVEKIHAVFKAVLC